MQSQPKAIVFFVMAFIFSVHLIAQSFNPFNPENAQKEEEWRNALQDTLSKLDDAQVHEIMKEHLPSFKDIQDLGWGYLAWGNRLSRTDLGSAGDIYREGINRISGGEANKILADLYLNLYITWAPNQVGEKLTNLQNADSVIQLTDDAELKFKVYQRYAVFYAQTSQPNKNEVYRNKALKHAKELGSTQKLASMYANMSMFSQHFGQMDSAMYFVNLAARQDSVDQVTRAKIHLQRSKLFVILAKVDSAATDLNKAYSLFEEIEDRKGMIISLEDLMGVYGQQGDYDQSLKVAARLRKYLSSEHAGAYYYHVAKSQLYLGNLEEASIHADSLKGSLKYHPSVQFEASSFSLSGEVLCTQEEWETGLAELYKAYDMLNTSGFENRAVSALQIFFDYYTKILEKGTLIKLPQYGINSADDLIPVLKQITDEELANEKMDFGTHQFFTTLSAMYQQTKQYDLALEYLKYAQVRKDSIYNREKFEATQKINLQTKEIETERVEAELRATNVKSKADRDQQRTMKYWAFSIAGLLIILVLFAIYQLRKNRQHTAQLEEQKRFIEQQRDQLSQLDNLKSNFFANISHELRTPLTLILGPLTDVVQKRKTELPSDISQLLQMAYRNGSKLQELVNEILDLGKLEVGELTVETRPVLLHQLTKRIFYTFESLAIMKSVSVVYEYHLSEQQAYLVDDNKLDKILSNLVINALKFTANGEIKLVVEQRAEQVAFVVSDTGVGILPEDLPKVFDRYFQGATNKEGGGTGIGLSFAQQLAELMGGSLTATSNYSKGSEFTLLLPLQTTTEKVVLEEPEIPGTEDDLLIIPDNLGVDTKVLVVEDNPEMRQYIKTTLSSQFNVTLAGNGREALNELERARFDLILSDFMMPEMDGMELLKTVKQNPDWKNTPFVMLTAKATDKDRLQALNVGLDDYLLKPFNSAELTVRMANLIQNSKERTVEEPEENEDQQWLQKVQSLTESRLTDRDFNVAALADDLNMVERQVYRKMKKLTGLTPNKFIQEMRLRQARNYLESGTYKTVKEVAASVGFDTYQYFTKIYVQRFGKKPVDYLR